MAPLMSGRQRTFIRNPEEWAWPVLAYVDDKRVYVAIDQKEMARHWVLAKWLLVGFAAVMMCIMIVVTATSIPTMWQPTNFMVAKLAVGAPLGFLLTLFVLSKVKPKFMEVQSFPHTAADLPLFFIDAAKGYAGDCDDCFAIQEIESINIGATVDTPHEQTCIAVKLRNGKTHLFAPVHSFGFRVDKVAQQAEVIRRRFVPPTTPPPKPTETEFEMPAMN